MVKKEEEQGIVKGKGVKYMVTEDDLTLCGQHTKQYKDCVSQKCAHLKPT